MVPWYLLNFNLNPVIFQRLFCTTGRTLGYHFFQEFKICWMKKHFSITDVSSHNLKNSCCRFSSLCFWTRLRTKSIFKTLRRQNGTKLNQKWTSTQVGLFLSWTMSSKIMSTSKCKSTTRLSFSDKLQSKLCHTMILIAWNWPRNTSRVDKSASWLLNKAIVLWAEFRVILKYYRLR